MPGPRLDGKVALITGTAGGIASAAARRLVSDGAQRLLTDTREQDLQALAGELGNLAAWRVHDVSSEEDRQAVAAWAAERQGPVDVLLNNAGVFLAAPLADTTVESNRRGRSV